MKVLWFSLSPCGSLRRFGKERIVQGWMISLEDALKKEKDIDLSVAYFSTEEKDSFEFDGVTYYPMFVGGDKNGFQRIASRYRSMDTTDGKMLPVMLNVVKAAEPDLIHIHGTEERFGLIQDYIHDIPIAFSIQGLIAPFSLKFFNGLPLAEIRKHESLGERLRKATVEDDYKGFLAKAKRELHYLSKAKYIFGRTFWDEDITFALNTKRNYYLVDEILRNPFYNVRWQKEDFDKKSLMLVSTLSGAPYKGYETILRTAEILKKYSGIKFSWKVIGYAHHNKLARISSSVTGIKPEDVCVELPGRQGAEALAQTLSDSDIFVQVSHIENSPNALCEAMLVGMPIIASFAGGTASMLESGKEGVLVQDGDPYVLAGAIASLAYNFEKAKKLAENAHNRAIERHNPQRIVRQLLDAYHDILNSES